MTGRTTPVTTSEQPSMEEAIAILQEEGVTNHRDYVKKRPDNPSLQRLPYNLHQAYPGFSWSAVTGQAKRAKPVKRATAKEKPSMEEAIAILQEEGVTSTNYREKRETNPRLQQLPANLYKAYSGFSWHLVKGRPYNLH